MHQQEVAGKAQLIDDAELVIDLIECVVMTRVSRRVAHLGAPAGEESQPGHLRVAGRHRMVGKVQARQTQLEGGGRRKLDAGLERPGITRQATSLLTGRSEMSKGTCRKPSIERVETPTGTNTGEGHGQWTLCRGGVMHVVRGDNPHTCLHRKGGEGIVAWTIERVAVIPELHEHPVTAEGLHQLRKCPASRPRPLSPQRTRDRPLATAGQDVPTVVVGARLGVSMHRCPRRLGKSRKGEACETLPACELGVADGPGESGIANRTLREHDEMRAGRVGLPSALAGCIEGELGAEDGRQPMRTRSLRKLHRPVEPVVIGEGQTGETQAHGLVNELVGMTRAVEEREAGVAVQLRVGHALGHQEHEPSATRRPPFRMRASVMRASVMRASVMRASVMRASVMDGLDARTAVLDGHQARDAMGLVAHEHPPPCPAAAR